MEKVTGDSPVRATSSSSSIPTTVSGDALRPLCLIAGNSSKQLGQAIAAHLGMPLAECELSRFADGEAKIQIQNNVRGMDVFVIASTCSYFGPHNTRPVVSVNDNMMELLLLLHTLKLSSAGRVTAVIPYFGYARQSEKLKGGTPISASAIAKMIETMGAHRVLTVDLLRGQIQGFFHTIPVDNLWAEEEEVKVLSERIAGVKDNVVIVAAEALTVPRAKRVADALGVHRVASILERRAAADRKLEGLQLVGSVEGSICIIVDTLIDTGTTLVKEAQLLHDAGAIEIIGCATHGIFSERAIDLINASHLTEVYTTDSIAQEANVARCKKLRVLSISPLLANAIYRVHYEKSVSDLFVSHQKE